MVVAFEYKAALKSLKARQYGRTLRGQLEAIRQVIDTPEALPDDIRGMLEDVLSEAVETSEIPYFNAKDGIDEACHNLLTQEKGGVTGLCTGFPNLDYKMRGLRGGQFIIIAARPSVGKTALALNVCNSLAQRGKNTLVFSYEMDRMELQERILLMNMHHRHRDLHDAEAAEKVKAQTGNILIVDNARVDDTKMRSMARLAKSRNNISAIVVDYLQLMHSNKRFEGRQQEVTHLSGGLKALAKELEIPVIALSQFNRLAADATPQLHHLRESGSLEQDADKVLLMWEDGVEEEDEVRHIVVKLAKNRQGPRGQFDFSFCPEVCLFLEDGISAPGPKF